MADKVRPHKQNSFRATNEFANIARTVGEVDDYVLQEFLTDIIDGGAVGPGAGGPPGPSGAAGGVQANQFGGLRQPSFGMSEFNAAVANMASVPSPFPGGMVGAMEVDTNAAAGGGAAPITANAGAFAVGTTSGDKKKPAAKGKKSRRNSRVSNTGSDDDQEMDADVRRKRQREANLQAQRRCRERHRNHVTNLESEVDALRATANAATTENARLQTALQRSLLGLEDCQRRWHSMDMQKMNAEEMKTMAETKLSETMIALRECASRNEALTIALRKSVSPANSNPASDSIPASGSGADLKGENIDQAMGGMDIATSGVKPDPEQFGDRILGGPLATQLKSKAKVSAIDGLDDSSISLQKEATDLEARANTGDVSEEDMKRVALRLTKQFRTYLVDGNACSSAVVFGSIGDTTDPANQTPAGPGQTRSVLKRANEIAKALDLSEIQRAQILKLWKTHSEKLHKLFERRKQLTADALMLQGTSPVATLVDFLSIESGTLSAVRNEEELMERGGQMTLTGFAQHACRLQGVISELRDNIGAEQMQNFVLVSEVVDDVFTPLQTCNICATWGPECPDMLAISRAITVLTMEANGLRGAVSGKRV